MNEPRRVTVPAAERARLEAIDELVAVGVASIPRLLDMLTDPSWAVRRQVVAALGSLGTPAVAPLGAILRTRRDDEARIAAAVDALVGSVGEAEPEVVKLAQDANPAVVSDAAQILGRRRSTSSVPVLVGLLAHGDDNVAVAAIEALGNVGGRAAVDALVSTVQSGKFFRTYPAIDVLGRCGDPRAVAPLAALLGDPKYALEACRALGRTGEKSAVAPLANLLASPLDSTVRSAALALVELEERYRDRFGAAAMASLEEALKRAAAPQPAVRRLTQCVLGAEAPEQVAICVVLGTLGSDAAVPTLTRLLDSPVVASAAAQALKRIARSDSEQQILKAVREGDSARRLVLLPAVVTASSVDDVVLCLMDTDPAVRALACDTLARIGNPRAVKAIFARLEDSNPRVVQAAVAAIQSLGSSDTEALALAAARSSAPNVRRSALRILAYFGYVDALPVFLGALEDADPRVREAALQGLPFLEDPKALEAILGAARSGAERTRASAMRALGQCASDERVIASLMRGLSDADGWVRYYAAQALGKLCCEDAAERIAKLLGDEAGQVRVAAVEALSHLRSPVALDALRGAARSPEPDVQRAALIGLGIGRRPESLEVLLDAASSPDPATRLVALSAVAGFAAPQALMVLARAAGDADESVRTAAIGFLASWPGAEATRVLIDFLHERASRERVLAALATPSQDRVGAVLTALEHADDELAPLLTATLARLNRGDATAAIFQALTLPNVPARKAAASTLAALGTRDAIASLKRCALEDANQEVRRICSLLLAQ